ncbi:MAG: hypothetical protein LBJ00_00990 [Planctomycetaceae bacterium]|nr:hypothetical protein [Planctomycetaceae bacterium]
MKYDGTIIFHGLFFVVQKIYRHRYTEATLKFLKLNTQAQQREAVVQGRSLSPYRLRYIFLFRLTFLSLVVVFRWHQLQEIGLRIKISVGVGGDVLQSYPILKLCSREFLKILINW